MDIEKYIKFQMPDTMISCRESDVELLIRTSDRKIHSESFENLDIASADPAYVQYLKRYIKEEDAGLLLGAESFIYNFIDIPKLPFKETLKREVVSWKLDKTVPDSIDLYEMRFFEISKTRIFTILIRKEIKKALEKVFEEHGINIKYFGNTTIEIFNSFLKSEKVPDFFIEAGRERTTLFFIRDNRPLYIRKIISDNSTETCAEIMKTIAYVDTTFSFKSEDFAFFSSESGLNTDTVSDFLINNDLNCTLKTKSDFFFRGNK